MNVKTKIILMYPLFGFRNMRARKIAKKANKPDNEERYPIQWRNDVVVKRARQFLKLMNVNLKVKGFDNIPKGSTIIAPNHSSAIDPAVLMAALHNPDESIDAMNQKAIFIAKEELKKNKRFVGYANLINTFYIDRKSPRKAIEILDKAVAEAKESKRHLVIFPEGTRSHDGTVQEFKGGAFKIAKKAFLPVIPVTINNSFSGSDTSRNKPLEVEIIFHKPIKPLAFMSTHSKGLAKRIEKIVKTHWVKPKGKRADTESKIA